MKNPTQISPSVEKVTVKSSRSWGFPWGGTSRKKSRFMREIQRLASQVQGFLYNNFKRLKRSHRKGSTISPSTPSVTLSFTRLSNDDLLYLMHHLPMDHNVKEVREWPDFLPH